MIITAVGLSRQNSSEAAPVWLSTFKPAQMTNVASLQDRELAELQQRLETFQQILHERGYIDDGGASAKSSQAKAQAERVHIVDDFKRMETSLEERVKALTSGSQARDAQKSRFTKMMEERGRRFLYES